MMPTKRKRIAASRPSFWFTVASAMAIVVTLISPNFCNGHYNNNNGEAAGGGDGDGEIGTNYFHRYLQTFNVNNYVTDFSNAKVVTTQKLTSIPARRQKQKQQQQRRKEQRKEQRQERRIESKTNNKIESGKSGKDPTTTTPVITDTTTNTINDAGETAMSTTHGSKSSKVSKHNIWEGGANDEVEGTETPMITDTTTTTINDVGETAMSTPHGSKSSKVSKHNIWEGGANDEVEGTESSSLFAPTPTSSIISPSTTFDFSLQPSSVPSSSPQPTSSNRPSSNHTMTSYPSTFPRPTSTSSSLVPSMDLVGEQPFLWSTQGTSSPTTAFQLDNTSNTPLQSPSSSSATDNFPTTTETTTSDGNDAISNGGGQVGQIDKGPVTSGTTVVCGMTSRAVSTAFAMIMVAIGM